MGRRGPAPTPSPILEARNSWRAKANKRQPKEIGEPVAPDDLPPDAARVWSQVAPLLKRMGVLGQVHANVLTRYSVSVVRWKRVTRVLETEGETYEVRDEGGKVRYASPRPEVSIARGLAAELHKLEQELGLTPASRTRIQIGEEDNKPDDKARFFRPLGWGTEVAAEV